MSQGGLAGSDSDHVLTIAGTANRITVTGDPDAVIDIASTYVGQNSITTLGTVSTGVWNGTAVDVAHGGTGDSSLTAYSLLCGGTTSTAPVQPLASVGSAGQVLTSNGAAALPTFQSIPTAVTSVSGTTNRITSTGGTTPVIDIDMGYIGQSSLTTLGTITTGVWNATTIDVSHGGTGDASLTAYSLLCGGTTSTGAVQSVASVGSSGQILTSNGAGALPTFQTATTPVTSVSGTSNRITSTGGTTPVIDISASYVGQSSITTLGTIGTGVWNGTAVDVAHGGSGDTSHTAYSVLCGGTTSTAAVQSVASVGTTGQVLTSTGASSLPTFQTPASSIPAPPNATGLTLGSNTWYQTYSYTTPINGTSNGTISIVQSDRLYTWVVYLPYTASFTSISTIITTLAAGNIRFGLYPLGANGRPGALVCDSGSISSGTTGIKTGSVSFAITAGYYYFALNNSSVGHSFRTISSGSRIASSFVQVTSTDLAGSQDAFYYDVAYAALPDPYPFASATSSTYISLPLFFMA